MSRLQSGRQLFALLVILIAAAVLAQAQQEDQFEPVVGQAGKDVVWVPTPQELVDSMLDMAKVTPQDYVIDLGSGDGRTVISAAKLGARALGIEYNPQMIALSRRHAAEAGVSDKAKFVQADLFQSDFSEATVITMFLLPHINLQLRPKILEMKPGTRVVSNNFDMAEWEPDKTVNLGRECTSWCTAYLWIVPAKVEGKWQLPQGELDLEQEFQKVSGILLSKGSSTAVNGKLEGDKISFSAGKDQYTGHVNGNTISGIAKLQGGDSSWTAKRIMN
jgi:SAM-dependent methyltransferase